MSHYIPTGVRGQSAILIIPESQLSLVPTLAPSPHKVAFWDYLSDRVFGANKVPLLPEVVRQQLTDP
jgi:hypothetical protein